MDFVFALLVLIGMIALVLGMVKPSLAIRWKDAPTRSNVFKVYGGLIIVSFIAFLYVIPKVELTPEQKEKIAIEKHEQIEQKLEEERLNKIEKAKKEKELEQKKKIAKKKKHQQKLINEQKKQEKKVKQDNKLDFIIKDTLMDENNNDKLLDAVSMRWITKNNNKFDLILNKNNFKQGFTYVGGHKKDEYYNKYITNLWIGIDLDSKNLSHTPLTSTVDIAHYSYTPTIRDCEVKIKLLEINKKAKLVKFKIKATLVNRIDETHTINDIFTIEGNDYLELEKILSGKDKSSKVPREAIKIKNDKDISKIIFKKDYGDKWAFTSDSAILKCYQDGNIKSPVVVVNGRSYGLTGFADAKYGQSNLKAFNNIWLEDKNIKGLMVDIGIFQKEATKLCEK